MKIPATPANEHERLHALSQYQILDTPAEAGFDGITELAAHLLDMPIALISIVDGDRQWFKSRHGLAAPQTPRDVSFCGHVVAEDAPVVIDDALADARFVDNPLVTGGPQVRFYAGMPLRTADGFVLGTLCVIDHEPRSVSGRQLDMLALLARQAMDQLELRRRNLLLVEERGALEVYRQFFDIGLDLLCTVDSTLCFSEVSPAWERVLGWTKEALGGRVCTDLVHPDDLRQTLDQIERLLNEGASTVQFENRYRRRDGHWIDLSWVGSTRCGVIFLAARDVSAYRDKEAALLASERRLRQSEARLRALFEGMAEGVVLQDRSGGITSCNPAAERILGLTEEQMKGRTSVDPRWQSTHPDGSPFPGDMHPAMRTLQTGQPMSDVLMRIQKPSGVLTWISINAQPLAIRGDADALGDAVVSTFHDITTQVTSAQAARSAEARLRAIIDAAPDAIITFDGAGIIEQINPAAERMFGYAPEELLGRGLGLLLPSLEKQRDVPNDEARPFPPGVDAGSEVEGLRRDGSGFPAELATSDFAVEGNRLHTSIIRDVSERKKVERLQSEFVSNVSHELRTPLTSIRGALGLVAGERLGPLPPEAKGCMELALANCDRLVRLINDLLDIDKLQSRLIDFRLKPVELADAVRAAVAAHRAFAGLNRVELRLSGELAAGAVLADEDRLAQVLTNLLSNAVKFSPSGACVEVSVASLGQRMMVRVRDHGPGIAEAFRGHIFQRFAQADGSTTRRKGGTGLGLHICKSIVERMGGQIGFDDAPGGGAAFFFELPALGSPATRRKPSAAPRPVGLPGEQREQSRPPRLLHVEDDADLRRIVKWTLPPTWTVLGAGSVSEARRILGTESFDAVLLDAKLPDGEAEELLERIGKAQLVILSGDEAPRSLTRGAVAVLVKSRISEAGLREVITGLMASARRMASAPPGARGPLAVVGAAGPLLEPAKK